MHVFGSQSVSTQVCTSLSAQSPCLMSVCSQTSAGLDVQADPPMTSHANVEAMVRMLLSESTAQAEPNGAASPAVEQAVGESKIAQKSDNYLQWQDCSQ